MKAPPLFTVVDILLAASKLSQNCILNYAEIAFSQFICMLQRIQQIHPLLSCLHHFLGCSRHWLTYAFPYTEFVLDSPVEGSLAEELELLGGLGWDIAGSKNCVFRAFQCLGPMRAGSLWLSCLVSHFESERGALCCQHSSSLFLDRVLLLKAHSFGRNS